ncbi:MAG: hypothetical protein M9894_26950 [Planctomycetes bacterium]|nr:hypothetical protein [Planctomycetota bacterium]
MDAPRLRPRDQEAACPLCRERLGGEEERWRCDGCQAAYHRACASELGGCATLGCPRRGDSPTAAGSVADEILAALRARPLLDDAEAAPPQAPRAEDEGARGRAADALEARSAVVLWGCLWLVLAPAFAPWITRAWLLDGPADGLTRLALVGTLYVVLLGLPVLGPAALRRLRRTAR